MHLLIQLFILKPLIKQPQQETPYIILLHFCVNYVYLALINVRVPLIRNEPCISNAPFFAAFFSFQPGEDAPKDPSRCPTSLYLG